MYRSTATRSTTLRKRARREITRAINNAASPSLRDELIVIAQRGGLI